MIAALGRWLLGGGVSAIGGQLRAAYEAKLRAQNDSERLAAQETIEELRAAREIAVIEEGDRWSATRIGRLLIVVPFGVWWAMIMSTASSLRPGTCWTCRRGCGAYPRS